MDNQQIPQNPQTNIQAGAPVPPVAQQTAQMPPAYPPPPNYGQQQTAPQGGYAPPVGYPQQYNPYQGCDPHHAHLHAQYAQAYYSPVPPPYYAQQGVMPQGQVPAHYYGYPPVYNAPLPAPAPVTGAHDQSFASFFNFRDERFLKGAITGAALTFLLTNESLQKNTIKSLVKVWNTLQGGIEEVKERFQDAEAEIKSESQK
ncbi:YtxH domain-containing protein [Beggiatoa leptomitoformis]|uniref:YtxH domain-containing protein n=1 Tax=Beggiatoa leptomitoformis TaxID=288004 RepID=A0A2N9YA13_9GAMM|nr:YtxH domain-containing protein [Beggiatoa leptomitoformis]AUI67297.1 YtxH domain-containing protein [Beggiatoa leptomitoformis]QGX03582.1 YtxH domain-containing protein [Beggiatoa leptomitoformis]